MKTEYEGLLRGCTNPTRLFIVFGTVAILTGIVLQYINI